MIMLASGFNIYAQLDSDQPKTLLAASNKPKLSHGLADSHFGGGVANYAYDHFATLNYDDFKTKPA